MAGKFLKVNNVNQKQLRMLIFAVVALPLIIGGLFFSFKTVENVSTRAEQESIQINGSVSVETTPDGAKITWETTEPRLGTVLYGTSPDNLDSQVVSPGTTTNNNVTLPNLEADQKYYFKILIGDKTFDNNGQPWEITPSSDNQEEQQPEEEVTPEEQPEEDISPTSTQGIITLAPSITVVPTPEATDSALLTETPTPDASASPTIIAPTSSPAINCNESNCTNVWNNRSKGCTVVDYLKCVATNPGSAISSIVSSVTGTGSPTTATTVAPTSTTVDCNINYLQANSCTSWEWDDLKTKFEQCSDTYSRYFIQCKNSPFGSDDSGSTWYCNTTVSGNSQTLPCGTAPSPVPGQSVYCRVRAEKDEGGDANATSWVYANTNCARTTAANPLCDITYLQANTCRSFIWDLINNKDPSCKNSFDHYFLQCKSTAFTQSGGTWYCNTTVTDHYQDLPCYNAPTPADGASIYCRVRAEDSYSTTDHATDWEETSDICPTSTPTPSFTPTPTFTETPTPTRTPTP